MIGTLFLGYWRDRWFPRC